jgi:heterodisulfide reductase subunit C
MKITMDESSRSFAARVSGMIGQNIDGCYQCGKCTAGCPVAYTMDVPPHEIIRMVQLGLEAEALASHTIWLCASCETCTSRCPKNIDIAAAMDALRILGYGGNQAPAEREISLFHKLFLEVVGRFGRVNDLRLMGKYNLLTWSPLKDWRLGQKLFSKGKLKLTTPRLKDPKGFQEILTRTRAQEREEA